MPMPLASICSEFFSKYIYILKTWYSASADTQYKLPQKIDKNNQYYYYYEKHKKNLTTNIQ